MTPAAAPFASASADARTTPGLAANRGALLLLAAANFAIGLGAFVVIGILVPVADGFGVARGEAGRLMTVYAIAYALSSPVLVALTGAVARRRVLVAGLLLFAAGAACAAMASNFSLLLWARALMALGGGLVTPVAAAAGLALVAPDERGRALGLVFGGLTLAQALGVPAGAWAGYAFGWRTTFVLVALLSLAIAALLRARLSRHLSGPATDLGSLARVLAAPGLVVAVLFTALFIGGLYVVYTFLAPLLEARLDLGRDGVSAMLLVFGIGAVVGNMVGGLLTDRIGPGRTLVLLCLAQVALMPLLTLLPFGLAGGVALVALWSVCAWSFMVPQQARLAALRPDLTPVLFALNAAAIYLGASLGSALGGAVLGRSGTAALGPAGAAVILLALFSLPLAARLAGNPPARDGMPDERRPDAETRIP